MNKNDYQFTMFLSDITPKKGMGQAANRGMMVEEGDTFCPMGLTCAIVINEGSLTG